MKTNIVHLTDGTTMRANVNLGTLLYMEKFGLNEKMQEIEEMKKRKEEISGYEAIELTAKMAHVILLSNGRDVTFEVTLCLMPLDLYEIECVFKEFSQKLIKIKKKQIARSKMRNQSISTGRPT